MSGFPDEPFPERPFFSCSEHEFAVVDQATMAASLRDGRVEPWMAFRVAEGNVFESPPVSVLDNNHGRVRVRCRDAEVLVDFIEESARKTTAAGEQLIYMAGLDEANDGRGWLPVT